MIRLIASDMDGSLLDENKQIPTEFYEILPQLKKRGISFVVASGRSYCTLKENFKAVSDQIDYICDNGAYVVYNGETRVDTIPAQLLHPILQACEELGDIQALLCGAHGTYHVPYTPEFNYEISNYYVNQHLVPSLKDVDDDIFKIAICDMKNPEKHAYPYLRERLGEKLNMQISGSCWMDIMNTGINKGAALKKIQSDMGITPQETMAFGDFYNDIELLKRAYYSFVMGNSNEDMRRYGNFVAASNSEAGVIKAIRQYVLA